MRASTESKDLSKVKSGNVFIHFFGADGAGKTTQAKMLVYYLRKNGAKVKLVRIRSGRTIASLLYRFFAKLGPNLTMLGGDKRVIRIKTIRSKFDRQMWSWIEFLSMIPWLLRGVFFPLLMGKTVVAERYMIDAIATISYIVNDPKWSTSFLGRLLLDFIPHDAVFIHIDAPYATIQERKGRFVDPVEYIEFQRKTYYAYAGMMNAVTIDTSTLSKEETHKTIRQYLRVSCTLSRILRTDSFQVSEW